MTWLRRLLARIFRRPSPPPLPARVDPLPVDEVRTLRAVLRGTDGRVTVPAALAFQLAETVLDMDRRLQDAHDEAMTLQAEQRALRDVSARRLGALVATRAYAKRLQDLRAGHTPDDARCLHCGELYDGGDLDDTGHCSAVCRDQDG